MIKGFLRVASALCLANTIQAADVALTVNKQPILSEQTRQLHEALQEDTISSEKVKKLLKESADPNATTYEAGLEWDPLSLVIFQGNLDLVKPLLDAGADPKKSMYPSIGFMAALVHGREGGCDKFCTDEEHTSFCFFARAQKYYKNSVRLKRAYVQALQQLIEKKAYVDGRIDDHPTALIMAAERGHADVCKTLLQAGANPQYSHEPSSFFYKTDRGGLYEVEVPPKRSFAELAQKNAALKKVYESYSPKISAQGLGQAG